MTLGVFLVKYQGSCIITRASQIIFRASLVIPRAFLVCKHVLFRLNCKSCRIASTELLDPSAQTPASPLLTPPMGFPPTPSPLRPSHLRSICLAATPWERPLHMTSLGSRLPQTLGRTAPGCLGLAPLGICSIKGYSRATTWADLLCHRQLQSILQSLGSIRVSSITAAATDSSQHQQLLTRLSTCLPLLCWIKHGSHSLMALPLVSSAMM